MKWAYLLPLLSLPPCWAVDQTYVVRVTVSEESTGPGSENRTQYDPMGPDVNNVHLRTYPHLYMTSSDPDVVRGDGECSTNGWSSTGMLSGT